MKLKRILWRNIGPYGNKIQSLEFCEEGCLWLVLGKNGHGKSFLINLPKLLFYGKLDKFKKDDIANRFNKHGWLRGEIQINNDNNVIIERTFSPSNLIVEKNGEDIGKSGIQNYQDYIDNEVTGLPYHIFSNIISLSVNDFKSFISMTPYDKRTIIDKLFAMEIINKMNELVKKDLRDIKINIDLYDREINSLQSQINRATQELDELKQKINEDNSNKINEILNKLTELKPKLKDAYNKLVIYNQKKTDIDKAHKIFLQQKMKLEHDISSVSEQQKLYAQDKCPVCATPFTESRFDILKNELDSKHKDLTNQLEILLSSESKYATALNVVNEGINKLNKFIIQAQTVCKTLENELTKLKVNKTEEFVSIQNIIADGKIKLTESENKKMSEDEDMRYLTILEQLYSDNGVKRRILDNYLPTLNKEIEYTLSELHFPYTLEFNFEFDPQLTHLGIEVNVDTLSTGEKKRVDLAVLISIIRMLKRKYPNLNIFMLDEVLSSIDQDGIYDIIGMLQRTAKELSMNILIINHSPLPIEQFQYQLTIEKKDGFSDINLIELNN